MTNAVVLETEAAAPQAVSSGSRPAPKTGMKYRPDVDGLRAVAVLSVLAFHIGLSRFQGGFVGVDVFFVISGYLISSIIFAEISASHFTITGFYERRIRRIFPALFAMLAVSSIIAAICLLPTELVDYAKSMLSATCSASNIFFWLHSGYFDAPTSKPLLHTWSLAVEEQFYLTFPVLLLLVRRFFPRSLRGVVGILFIASFAASCIVVRHNPDTAFYMPYTRAWELLLGTLLSLRLVPALRSGLLRNVATLSGAGMILWAVLFYSQATLFPGFSALLPCVGSALLIWAGEAGGSVVSGVLSWRPVVFIGLISYSLYLWHWPIIILRQMGLLIGVSSIHFAGHQPLLSTHRFDIVVEVTLSFLLAVLSWKFVELPFRSGSLRLTGRSLFALAGGVMVCFLAGGAWVIAAQGLPRRFPEKALQVAASLASEGAFQSMRTGTCFITTDYRFESYDRGTCLHEVSGKKNYLLVGDSHSAMLWSALASEVKQANVMQASTANCIPALVPDGRDDCRKMMTYIFQRYLPTHSVQGLFLAARWEPADLGPLSQLIAWAQQRQLPVVVFGPVPEYDAPLPRLLAYSIAWKKPSLAEQHLVPGPKLLDMEMQQLADTTWHVPYMSLYKEICSESDCEEYADRAHRLPLMGDDNHLSMPGASVVIQRLVDKGDL
jgi:peptidoglycan/LPS O-acetylase OafA/YrhL